MHSTFSVKIVRNNDLNSNIFLTQHLHLYFTLDLHLSIDIHALINECTNTCSLIELL